MHYILFAQSDELILKSVCLFPVSQKVIMTGFISYSQFKKKILYLTLKTHLTSSKTDRGQYLSVSTAFRIPFGKTLTVLLLYELPEISRLFCSDKKTGFYRHT